jgi:ribonuclease T2
MRTIRLSLALFSIVLLLPFAIQADIRLDGYFIAQESCAALQSIRKNTNPGDVHLTEDMAYEVISKNKAEATHYRIRVKQANPKERWVMVSCGKLLTNCHEQTVGIASPPAIEPPCEPCEPTTTTTPPAVSGKDYLLALTWQPAFCQTHQQKTECQTQTPDRYDASNFALHGLWPQPRNNVYCNVSNSVKKLDERRLWEQLPALGLTEATYSDLIETMPGVASYLHRHEWIKHGSCYSTTPEEYYRESIMLTDQINNSAVRDFFAENIGERVTASDIKAKYDAAFGDGAGDKVRIRCNDGMITETWINLRGEIDDNSQIRALLQQAEPADSSCQSGVIDPVGF